MNSIEKKEVMNKEERNILTFWQLRTTSFKFLFIISSSKVTRIREIISN